MEFLENNYEWIFSGIGVAVLGWFGFFLFKKTNREDKKTYEENTNNISITNNVGTSSAPPEKVKTESDKCDKTNFRILFIDDKHTEFKMVSQLKKAGWIHTKAVKDIVNLDDPKVKEASLIFVDINGVGTQLFEDQGIGLAAALKEKYENKTVILYSSDPEGDRFNKKLKKIDDSLPKNADPYEFISMIEQYCNK